METCVFRRVRLPPRVTALFSRSTAHAVRTGTSKFLSFSALIRTITIIIYYYALRITYYYSRPGGGRIVFSLFFFFVFFPETNLRFSFSLSLYSFLVLLLAATVTVYFPPEYVTSFPAFRPSSSLKSIQSVKRGRGTKFSVYRTRFGLYTTTRASSTKYPSVGHFFAVNERKCFTNL